jgi:hypothetical protein
VNIKDSKNCVLFSILVGDFHDSCLAVV